MTDYDYEAIAAGVALVNKARRTVENRRYTDKVGSDWRVSAGIGSADGCPTYVGRHGKAVLYATDDGKAYEVNIYTYAGQQKCKKVRKTLDSALRLGQKLANES